MSLGVVILIAYFVGGCWSYRAMLQWMDAYSRKGYPDLYKGKSTIGGTDVFIAVVLSFIWPLSTLMVAVVFRRIEIPKSGSIVELARRLGGVQ